MSLFEVFPSGVASLVSLMFWVFTGSGLLGIAMFVFYQLHLVKKARAHGGSSGLNHGTVYAYCANEVQQLLLTGSYVLSRGIAAQICSGNTLQKSASERTLFYR